MSTHVITREDLHEFRKQLLEDIREIVINKERPVKPWLKNAEVRKLLGISSSTIQRLRISGRLRSTKLGGVHYYNYDDIQKLLNGSGYN